MDIKDSVKYVLSQFPEYSSKVIEDVDKKGEDFVEILLSPKLSDKMTVVVTITQGDECYASVGSYKIINDKVPLSVENICILVEDIINDQVVFVVGYKNLDDCDDKKDFFWEFFCTSEDEQLQDYKKLIKTLEKPLKGLVRYVSPMKGVFVAFNYSGSIYQKYER